MFLWRRPLGSMFQALQALIKKDDWKVTVLAKGTMSLIVLSPDELLVFPGSAIDGRASLNSCLILPWIKAKFVHRIEIYKKLCF